MPKRPPRSFTTQSKSQVVLEVLTSVKTQAEVGRQYGLTPKLVAHWKDLALDRLETLFQGEAQDGQDQARIAELERMVSRLTGGGCEGPTVPKSTIPGWGASRSSTDEK